MINKYINGLIKEFQDYNIIERSKKGNKEIVELLINKGVDINITDENG